MQALSVQPASILLVAVTAHGVLAPIFKYVGTPVPQPPVPIVFISHFVIPQLDTPCKYIRHSLKIVVSPVLS